MFQILYQFRPIYHRLDYQVLPHYCLPVNFFLKRKYHGQSELPLLALTVNLTQSRFTWEENLSEVLSCSACSEGMSGAGDYLHCINWQGKKLPTMGRPLPWTLSPEVDRRRRKTMRRRRTRRMRSRNRTRRKMSRSRRRRGRRRMH